jgi:signal peptidase I
MSLPEAAAPLAAPPLTDPGSAALVALSKGPKKPRRTRSFWLEAPVLIAIAFILALGIKATAFAPFYIPSGSMRPTLIEGDRILVNKLSYKIHDPGRGDIVVFQQGDSGHKNIFQRLWSTISEGLGRPPDGSRDLVKRVIGMPGETIEVKTDGVYINGQKLNEPWLRPQSAGLPISQGPSKGPVHIPPESYFVMGDNRANSADSRVFGPIARGAIVGRAIFVVWPPGRLGGL